MSGKKLRKTKIDKESREKTQKRTHSDGDFEDDMARLISQYQASAKKKKMELVNSQIEERLQHKSNFFKRIADVTNKVEANFDIMKENKIKFDNIIGAFMKCIQQATDIFKQNNLLMDELKDITTLGQKDFEEMESQQTAETEWAMDELEYDIKKLQEKFLLKQNAVVRKR